MQIKAFNQIYKNKNERQNKCQKNTAFTGTTKIFALTDSHLQTRDKCHLLSKILQHAKRSKNVLALDCGDLFKGIYPPQVEVDSYLKLKKLAPNLEVVINVGNNDPGYSAHAFNFFKKSVKALSNSGVHVVSANTWAKDGGAIIDGVKPYTIIKRDGDRLLVTGFCVNNLTHTTFGLKSEDSFKILESMKSSIEAEKPDGLIILNHDFYSQSQALMDFAKEKGIKVDLMIGGHEHNSFVPDIEKRIYYPEAFNRTMYQFDMFINKGISTLKNIKMFKPAQLKLAPALEKGLLTVEKKERLMEEVAPSVLNLTKSYSNPGALGTFMADVMKKTAKTDVAFFSTGFLMSPLPYVKGGKILEFDIKKTMTGKNPVEKISATPDLLKKVFENALKNRMITDKDNPRFLQCSKNMKLVGVGNPFDKTYKIKQIFINGQPLFDETTGRALNPNKKITCTIDSYIGSGGQNFTMLKELPKERLHSGESEVCMTELLKSALKAVSLKRPQSHDYPVFELVDM